MNKLFALLALLMVFVLSACGGTTSESDISEPAPVVTTEDDMGELDDEWVDEIEEDAAALQNLPFGETYAYADGVEVSTSEIHIYEPGDAAVGHDQAVAVRFDVTATNGTNGVLEAVWFTSAESDGVEASRIIDVGEDISGPPLDDLQPGETVTWSVAWSVESVDNLIFRVAPRGSDEDAVFEG